MGGEGREPPLHLSLGDDDPGQPAAAELQPEEGGEGAQGAGGRQGQARVQVSTGGRPLGLILALTVYTSRHTAS